MRGERPSDPSEKSETASAVPGVPDGMPDIRIRAQESRHETTGVPGEVRDVLGDAPGFSGGSADVPGGTSPGTPDPPGREDTGSVPPQHDDPSWDGRIARWGGRLQRLPSRRLVWLWAASLAVVAVAASAVTGALVRHDPQQVAILGIDEDFVFPGFLGAPAEAGAGYEDFLGLSVIRFGDSDPRFLERICVGVMLAEDVDGQSISFSSDIGLQTGCSAGSFPAAASVEVTDAMPEELRDRFPIGTGLQFVLDGDHVTVRVAAAIPTPAESRR